MMKKRNHDHQESQAKYHQLIHNKDGFHDLQVNLQKISGRPGYPKFYTSHNFVLASLDSW